MPKSEQMLVWLSNIWISDVWALCFVRSFGLSSYVQNRTKIVRFGPCLDFRQQKRPKSKQNRSVVGQMPKSEQFDNRTSQLFLKFKLVRISDIDCMCLKFELFEYRTVTECPKSIIFRILDTQCTYKTGLDLDGFLQKVWWKVGLMADGSKTRNPVKGTATFLNRTTLSSIFRLLRLGAILSKLSTIKSEHSQKTVDIF